jgi:hypothetical protein
MPGVHFSSFTLEATPAVTDILVGYRSTATGGERRTTLDSLNTLFQAKITTGLMANALLKVGGAGALEASDLLYSGSTLTVPASFGITGAGSLAFTAGGSNQPVTITPSDSGAQGAVTTRASYASQTIIGTGGLQVVKQAVSGSIFPSVELIGYQNSFTAQPFIVVAKSGGTESVPTTTTAAATIGGYRFYTRANSAWRNAGNISANTSAGFGDADFSTSMFIGPSSSTGQFNLIGLAGGSAATGIGTGIVFGNVTSPITQVATTYFNFDSNNVSRSSAWGASGVNIATVARTYTDTVSSGTVATAVANSFAVPTFAASSATTFTNAANLYIAGDVAAGAGPVTLTNSYGLWNVGKTRLDGAVIHGTGSNGQSLNVRSLTELTTVAAAATTTTTIQMPANSIILSVSVRVTTVIPTATSFSVGDAGSATRFSTANVAVAANTTDVGTKAAAYYNATAAGIVLTMNGGTPAANTGRVRVTIAYIDVTPPSS